LFEKRYTILDRQNLTRRRIYGDTNRVRVAWGEEQTLPMVSASERDFMVQPTVAPF